MTGKHVRLLPADGPSGGLTTAETANGTGRIVSARRSDLAELLAREEAERTGLYFLLGAHEDAVGNTQCYIGEADTVATRLRTHAKDKPFGNQAVGVFTRFRKDISSVRPSIPWSSEESTRPPRKETDG